MLIFRIKNIFSSWVSRSTLRPLLSSNNYFIYLRILRHPSCLFLSSPCNSALCQPQTSNFPCQFLHCTHPKQDHIKSVKTIQTPKPDKPNPCTDSNSTTHASQSLQITLLSSKQTKAKLTRSFSTFIEIHHPNQ